MKSKIFLIISFYSFITFSQEKLLNSKIEYDMSFLSNKYNATLLYNNENSIYTYFDLSKDSETTDDDGNINITVSDTIPNIVFLSLIDKKTYHYTSIFSPKKHEWVEESTTDFNWIIYDETKTISNFLCNKATCSFRGRNYIAWFTPIINNAYGPWKFCGLPGLILEIYDTENEVNFLVKNISIPFNSSVEIKPFNTIPFEKVKQIQKEKLDELIDNLESKQERGFTIKVKVNNKQQIERE